jgi:hypothetical protein
MARLNPEPKIDKRRLKKHHNYGYYVVVGHLIHFYDKRKRYEATKIK